MWLVVVRIPHDTSKSPSSQSSSSSFPSAWLNPLPPPSCTTPWPASLPNQVSAGHGALFGSHQVIPDESNLPPHRWSSIKHLQI